MFKYTSDEQRAELELLYTPTELDPLEARGQLMLWAHLLAQLGRLAHERHRAELAVMTERLATARRFYPAEADELELRQGDWRPFITELDPARPVMRVFRRGDASRSVEVRLERWQVVVRGLPLDTPWPSNERDARDLARALVLRIFDGLA